MTIKATLKRLVTPNPFAGSILDLVGGRTYAANTHGDMKPISLVYLPSPAAPAPLWPACRPEKLGARVKHTGRAFRNVADLLG